MKYQRAIDKLPENRAAARELRVKLATVGSEWTSLGVDRRHAARVEVRKVAAFPEDRFEFVRDVRETRTEIGGGPAYAHATATTLADAVRKALTILGYPWDEAGWEADCKAEAQARAARGFGPAGPRQARR